MAEITWTEQGEKVLRETNEPETAKGNMLLAEIVARLVLLEEDIETVGILLDRLEKVLPKEAVLAGLGIASGAHPPLVEAISSDAETESMPRGGRLAVQAKEMLLKAMQFHRVRAFGGYDLDGLLGELGLN